MIYQSISQPRNRSENQTRSSSSRIPDFVSIFQQGLNSSSINDYDDDPIYGQIGDMAGTSDEYFSSTSTNDYEFNRTNRKQQQVNSRMVPKSRNRSPQFSGDYGPSTLTMKHPYEFTQRRDQSNRHGMFATIARVECEPPKLPPRDKKKLSKQIDTIKSARNLLVKPRGERYRVEIPSPDYLEDDHHRDSSASKSQKKNSKDNNTLRHRDEEHRTRGAVMAEEEENIYDTMRKAYDQNWNRSKQSMMMASTLHPPKSHKSKGKLLVKIQFSG